MNVAILGTGPIGSTFALHLATKGHAVTVIARGERLAQLQRDGAIVAVDGRRAEVTVAGALDPTIAYDLVIVTVLAHQLDAVLPALKGSAAKTIMFMFNTFADLAPLRDAVGDARFAWGFPAIIASIEGGRLKAKVLAGGPQTTITTEPRWATMFSAAGIPTVIERDMQSWLRTHAVMIAVLMGIAVRSHDRGAGITGAEATLHARALREGLALVRKLGDRVTPPMIARLERIPVSCTSALTWIASRVPTVRAVGAGGPGEARALIDAMLAIDPTCEALRAIRP